MKWVKYLQLEHINMFALFWASPLLEIIFSSQQLHLKRSKTKKLLRPWLCNLPEVLNTGRAGLCTQDNQTHAQMSSKLLSVLIFFSPLPKEEIVTRFYFECPDKAALSGTSRTLIPPSSPSTRFNQLKHKPHSALRDFFFIFSFPPQIKPTSKQLPWPFKNPFSMALKHKIEMDGRMNGWTAREMLSVMLPPPHTHL